MMMMLLIFRRYGRNVYLGSPQPVSTFRMGPCFVGTSCAFPKPPCGKKFCGSYMVED
jgi:hypothetical protein